MLMMLNIPPDEKACYYDTVKPFNRMVMMSFASTISQYLLYCCQNSTFKHTETAEGPCLLSSARMILLATQSKQIPNLD